MEENLSPSLSQERWIPFLAACLAVGAILGGLLIRYEPVGHDPDRLYRPVKTELASSLRQGTLPFWSDKFGLGIPLVAESHAAAFYPPNWLLYRICSVSTAYRLSMWLHYLALAATMFAYSRQIGAAYWGASIASVAFTLCGFQTAHAIHEPLYHALPYLPLCLLATDKIVTTGRWEWIGALGLLWGVQITLGHFQLQVWTGGVSLFAGLWRVWQDRLPAVRAGALLLALSLGLGVAFVQLVPSFELAQMVGQFRRPIRLLLMSSYPLEHWNEPAVPGLFRDLAAGSESPWARYWISQDLLGFDFLFVGTLPLILAVLGFVGVGRDVSVWRVLIVLTLALATMPRWWPTGYVYLLQVPGFSFRCPARYTVITSFALCLLAGRGLDRAIDDHRFRSGLGIAGLYATLSLVWAYALPRIRPEFRLSLDDAAISLRVGLAVVTWIAAMSLLIVWRRRPGCAWIIFAFTTIELGAFYVLTGTTCWARPVPLPDASPVMSLLAKEPGTRRISGPLDDLPVSAGLIAGRPYTGFALPLPNNLLQSLDPHSPTSIRWLRRFGMTHLVFDASLATSALDEIFHGEDLALDDLTYQTPGTSKRRDWRVFHIRDAFPDVRLALHAYKAWDLTELFETLSARDAIDEAWYVADEAPPPATYPRARTARIIKWDGLSGEVEHDGSVEVILCRAFYPGWEVTINNEPPRPALPSNGGLLTACLDGNQTSRVSFHYQPRGMTLARLVSGASILLCLGALSAMFAVRRGRRLPASGQGRWGGLRQT